MSCVQLPCGRSGSLQWSSLYYIMSHFEEKKKKNHFDRAPFLATERRRSNVRVMLAILGSGKADFINMTIILILLFDSGKNVLAVAFHFRENRNWKRFALDANCRMFMLNLHSRKKQKQKKQGKNGKSMVSVLVLNSSKMKKFALHLWIMLSASYIAIPTTPCSWTSNRNQYPHVSEKKP